MTELDLHQGTTLDDVDAEWGLDQSAERSHLKGEGRTLKVRVHGPTAKSAKGSVPRSAGTVTFFAGKLAEVRSRLQLAEEGLGPPDGIGAGAADGGCCARAAVVSHEKMPSGDACGCTAGKRRWGLDRGTGLGNGTRGLDWHHSCRGRDGRLLHHRCGLG